MKERKRRKKKRRKGKKAAPQTAASLLFHQYAEMMKGEPGAELFQIFL